MTAYKYTSKQGEYLTGIPARNLTDEDWAELSKEQRKAALDSGLYVKVETEAAPEKKTTTREEAPAPKAGG